MYMKNFNNFMEAIIIAKIAPQSDAVGEVEQCDACGNEPKDGFNSSADDFMKSMGMENGEQGENVIQPTDDVGEQGEIEGESEEGGLDIELNCLGEEGLEISFNGLKFVLPREVVEAIKGMDSAEGGEGDETEGEEHEEGETHEEEESEHGEGDSDENEEDETEENEDGKKNPFTESKKKGKAVNPWAICNKSTGGKKKAGGKKFEDCLMDVKKKNKIKK